MSEEKLWFPSKRYGFGWGLPTSWQGWVVCVGYLLSIGCPAQFLIRSMGGAFFIAYVVVLTTTFLFVCWKKGAPLQWRWGDQ